MREALRWLYNFEAVFLNEISLPRLTWFSGEPVPGLQSLLRLVLNSYFVSTGTKCAMCNIQVT